MDKDLHVPKDGGYAGYFAWHCKTDGTQLAANPASDGEIWFITALFFANGRWGSGDGIYNYKAEANSILHTAIHDDGRGDLATDLFNLENKQVVFVPQLGRNSQFTDPSYHMPHYYELWTRWADKDNDFWADAVTASHEYLPTSVHPETGLAPNYSEFDGKPVDDEYNGNFRYDSFRVGANMGMDYVWFAPSHPSTSSGQSWHVEQSNRLLNFFASQGIDDYIAEYSLDGEPLGGAHSQGLVATNAVAALAADRAIGEPFVQELWDLKVPTGTYRYYDGLLMMLALLQVSGNFRIYEPGMAPAGQVFPTPKPEVTGKFVPPSGKALLLVGQTANDVDSYFDATVTAPGGVAANLDLQLGGMDELNYLVGKYPNSALSVRVDLKDSLTIKDEQIDVILDTLISYDRPVFLHLRYGLDDAPDAYVSVWKRFGEKIQASGSTNAALVWESTSCEESNLPEFYPGDEVVDWIGANYECTDEVVQFAREHLKPVILTASSKGADWDTWFAPFIQFVTNNNDIVRAVTYINDFQMNDETLKRWKDETKDSFWLRASTKLFSELGFVE